MVANEPWRLITEGELLGASINMKFTGESFVDYNLTFDDNTKRVL